MKKFQKYPIVARIKTKEGNYICLCDLIYGAYACVWCDSKMQVTGIATMSQWVWATTWGQPLEHCPAVASTVQHVLEGWQAITPLIVEPYDTYYDIVHDRCNLPTAQFQDTAYSGDKNWAALYDCEDDSFESFFKPREYPIRFNVEKSMWEQDHSTPRNEATDFATFSHQELTSDTEGVNIYVVKNTDKIAFKRSYVVGNGF